MMKTSRLVGQRVEDFQHHGATHRVVAGSCVWDERVCKSKTRQSARSPRSLVRLRDFQSNETDTDNSQSIGSKIIAFHIKKKKKEMRDECIP